MQEHHHQSTYTLQDTPKAPTTTKKHLHTTPKPPKIPDYPGLGLDLRHCNSDHSDSFEPKYPLGLAEICTGSISELLLVRKVAMMIVMDRLTDKPGWHRKIFDDEIAGRWAAEAMLIPAEPFFEEIVGGKGEGFNHYIKPLKSILDEGCLDNVCSDTPISLTFAAFQSC